MQMTGEQIVQKAMARRAELGLRLRFKVPDRADAVDFYAKDEAQKAAWLKDAARKGWVLIDGA
jgi:hypothetical protein